MVDVTKNFHEVERRIREAEQAWQREAQIVKLLAVSKTKPLADVNALADLGQRAFGENYVQEALDKIAQRPDLEWHFIGPIQSNKTKAIAEHFAWVESVDRLKIAQRLSQQRPPHCGDLNILLQVNISGEANKSGFSAQELLQQAALIMDLPGLQVRGLMAIPKAETDFELQRQPFAQLKSLLVAMQERWPQARLDTLSMGMSADLEAAIAEGSTQVRIGSDLFGVRA